MTGGLAAEVRPVVSVEQKNYVEEGSSFEPTHTTYTPKLSQAVLEYRAPNRRYQNAGGELYAPEGSMDKVNYDDSLRRVSVVIYQHIARCEKRSRLRSKSSGINAIDTSGGMSALQAGRLISSEQDCTDAFNERHFVSPQYKYSFVRLPKLSPMTCYRMSEIAPVFNPPTVDEIYKFCRHLFQKAQLSAESPIVCLIYIERLMEQANVKLLANSWKPIVLCGLLMASKVWQDLSSWNVEISSVYPQFSVHSINRLERQFLHFIKWDLYISSSVYAKYYFALRALTEKKDFRRRYNYTVKVDPPNTKRLEERTQAVKDELYSRSV